MKKNNAPTKLTRIATALAALTFGVAGLACEDRTPQDFTTREVANEERAELRENVPEGAIEEAAKRVELRQDVAIQKRANKVDVLKARIDALEEKLDDKSPSKATAAHFEALEAQVQMQLEKLDVDYDFATPAERDQFANQVAQAEASLDALELFVKSAKPADARGS